MLAAQGKIDYQTFLFAEVGDDSENPHTLVYIREHAEPFAARHGIALHRIKRVRRDGSSPTVLEFAEHPERRSFTIPVRSGASGAMMGRQCTYDWKILVVIKWLRAHGAGKRNPAMTALGISTDEMHRARTRSTHACQVLDYPLLRLRLSRAYCRQIIADAGLPIPPKSSCWFCPFQSRTQWQRLRDEQPELFNRAVLLEQRLQAKAALTGHGRQVWLSNKLIPLAMATSAPPDTERLDHIAEDACESGYCLT